ncbi:unnamed protein product [Pocillopora meandrina]|uniref:Uncharacterized protein n=1 Tax=Pocillopora meandrina TaxID=46732 RepID=A0AAU9VTY5_9CNID|nr:unnamed protein product [Pocillopora meandrina]
MAQGGRDIMSSASKITQQAPGRPSVTTGSAWILNGPFPIDDGNLYQTSEQKPINQTFLATTNQVMRPRGGKTSWQAKFAPRKWLGKFKTDECYSIESDAFYEVPVSAGNTKLILIPTEYLHDQKTLSRWRDNKFQSKRSLPCSQEEKVSQFDRADAKPDELYCDVLTVQFSRKRYLFCVDDHESYFLESKRDEVQLRNLKDFQPNEIPKGAIILDKNECGVGLLAFDDKEDIRPLFFPQNLLDSNEQLPVSGSSNNNPNQPEGNLFLKEDNLEGSDKYGKDQAEGQLERETPKTSERQEYERQAFCHNANSPENEKQEGNAENNQGQPRGCGNGKEEKPQLRKHQHQAEQCSALQETELGSEKQQSTQIITTFKRWNSEQQATNEKPRPNRSLSERGHIPLGEEELVSVAVLRHINVMDHLKNHLDKSVRGIKNWRYLADLNDVPMEEQLKWGLGEDYSRSEKMFEALTCANPNLHMSVLVQHLKDLNINNVADYIVALKLEANMTVEEFFESPNRNTIGKVLMMLDLMDKEKWWSLGIKIELDAKSLKRINVDCKNQQEDPGSHVINIISTSQPTMIIGQFKKKLENIGRKDIAGKLKKLPEKAMIGKLLDNLELAREVTCMLNHSASPGVKYYEDLAAECGIPRETYESLQPPCADSPTQKTIEEIVQRKPDFTVEELFKNLIDMGRLDVIEAIRPYYEEKDVLALERKLRITEE